MRSRRHQVIPAALAAALALVAPRAHATGPLELGRVDIFTFELEAGAIGTPDSPPPPLPAVASADLHAGLIGAQVELLGLGASGLRFEAMSRPSLETTVLAGTLLDLDFFMIGARYPDVNPCFAFFSGPCDSDTGYLGFGATLLDMAGDVHRQRLGFRFVEGDLVASVTSAFDGDWKRWRFLPRLGASLDMIRHLDTDTNVVIGRLSAGFDALVTAGPLQLRPSFRYRPSFTAFVDDFALESTLRVSWRTAWEAWHNRDALTVGLELGHAYDRDPSHAFGADRVFGADHTLFARVVIEPTLFTVGPP